MKIYPTNDRRTKPQDELRDCPVKVRLTDSELETFYRGAVMSTEGKLAPFVLECALLGLRVKQEAQTQLMNKITGAEQQESKLLEEQIITAMQDLIRAGLSANQDRTRAA